MQTQQGVGKNPLRVKMGNAGQQHKVAKMLLEYEREREYSTTGAAEKRERV